MIIGSLSYFSDASKALEYLRKATDREGLVFHQIHHGGFDGGFYLQPRLPYTPDDFLYLDVLNDLVVLLWGAVYNRSELMHHFSIRTSVTDPELAAELFSREGPGFVKRLNGDFAIFLLQPAKKIGYLFRDHLGIRPIVWSVDRQTFCFSSDSTGMCRALSDGQVIESDYLMRYFKYIDYRKTPDRKVVKLLPGHYLCFSEKGIRIERYWEPAKIRIDKTLTHEKMLPELKSILCDAVKIRCDSRFKASAHVSSGLDSGIVSALARKEYQDQPFFYGFSWSPAEFTAENVEYDEREIVRKFCKKINILPLFAETSSNDFHYAVAGTYQNDGYFSEDRSADQAAKTGTNLIFTGWGGDEFISTGDRGIETDLLRGLKLRTFFKRNRIDHPKRFIKDMFIHVIYPFLGILNNATARSFRNDARYLKKSYRRSDRRALRNFYAHASRQQSHLRLLDFYHLQERCESWAISGYRKGVEYRYPLLDRRIIEYMLKVPSVLLCKTSYFRPLLREISEGILPDEIRWNWSKNDPAYWSFMDKLFSGVAELYMSETDNWEANPDLHFIDFELLTADIKKYRKNPGEVDSKVLFRALVYIKAIHDFTNVYHSA
jgi:asparagine synthase (glutamine-hydrolysing)